MLTKTTSRVQQQPSNLSSAATELQYFAGPTKDGWANRRKRVLNALLEASEVSERPAILRELTRLEAGQ